MQIKMDKLGLESRKVEEMVVVLNAKGFFHVVT